MYRFMLFSVCTSSCLAVIVALPKLYLDDLCGRTKTFYEPSVRIKLTRFSRYDNDMNCVATIKAASIGSQEKTRIMIVFRDLDIVYNIFGCGDYLELHDGTSASSPTISGLKSKYCGENRPRGAFMTSGDSLTLRFVSDGWKTDDGFDLLLTPFHTGVCNSSEHRCHRGQCISNLNKCDGYKQCGETLDECEASRQMTWIAGVVVSGLVIVGVIVAVVFCIRRRQATRGRTVNKYQETPQIAMQTMPPVQPVPPNQGYPAQPQGYPQSQDYPAQPQGYPQSQGYPAQPPPYPQQPGYPSAQPPNPYPYGAPQ